MAPPEKSLKFGPEHAAPTLKFGPEHSNTPEPTLPQRKAHLPITVAETTRAVLANDFAKSDDIWTNYLKVVAIRAPDNLRVGNNAAYHQLNMSMAEAYQDRSFLKIEENPEQWRQVQKNAANRAAAYFTANPAMSTGAKLDIVKSAYLMEMNRAKLPTPQENRDTTLNAYELQMNRAARDLQAVTETGEEGAGERHNALVRLRQASEEDKQGFMNWVSGSYFPQDVPQEADNFVLHGKYDARGYNDFPRYRGMLQDFRQARGWQDNQGAAADLHMSNMRMRDRLAGARLGIDDAISSDLSQRNLVLLDPTKDEGHQLLSSFLSTSTQEELTAPVTTDAQISRFLKKHTGATKAQARVALQLDRLQSLGDQRLVDRMDPNKLWTPEQVAKLNMPAAALKEVGGFFTDMFAAYTDAVDRSGGPVQRAINKYMISGTVSGFRPDDPAAKVLSAEADNVFEGMAQVLKYIAPGSRTLKRTQALREYHQNGPGVPLVAALAGLDEKLSMGALWRDYSQAMRENIADRQFRLNHKGLQRVVRAGRLLQDVRRDDVDGAQRHGRRDCSRSRACTCLPGR
jgi:hypothetical protein